MGIELREVLASLDDAPMSATRLCEAIERAAVFLQTGLLASQEEAIGERFDRLADDPDPRIRRAVAEAVFHLRTTDFERIIRRLAKDPWPRVAEMANSTRERRTALSKGDFVISQDEAQLGVWISELEQRHPGAGRGAKKIARRYANRMIRRTIHEMTRVISPLDWSVDHLREELGKKRPDREVCSVQLGKIDGRTSLLLTILRQLSDMTRAGSAACVWEPLRPIVEEAVELVRDPVPPKNRIRLVVKERRGSVKAEVRRAELVNFVFRNLVQNAYEAYDGVAERKPITISIEDDDDKNVIVTVTDHGAGMPEDLGPRLFATFGFTTKNEEIHGGMGLAVAKAIVDAHGGAISISGKPGEGASARVVLPKRQPRDEENQS